jgi:PQQ-dependent dehydrogenase (methanol/ethanol family)
MIRPSRLGGGVVVATLVLASIATLAAWAAEEPSLVPTGGPKAPPSGTANVSPVTDRMLEKPPAADWLMWRASLNSWGYSPLNQVNTRNVNQLQLVWTRPLEAGPQEGTPLVHDGVLYFPNPGDLIQAIDAASGEIIWEHRRQLPADIDKFINAPLINRNIAIHGNLIIDTTADGALYALDSRTGKEVWTTQVLDYKRGIHHTSGPIVADGKVFSGRGCEPIATAGPEDCVVTAHDAATGRELWRRRTIPKPGEAGDETWGNVPDVERKHVGTWMPPSYDPELKLLYIGTSVTSPAPKFLLDGNDKQYLYHNSTLALDPATGRIVWYYQHLVDHWDIDHTFERILVDTEVAPSKDAVAWINPDIKPRQKYQVLTGIPGKSGIVYTLDRRTGAFLWARPTVYQNLVESIDGKTGKVKVSPAVLFNKKGDSVTVCPNATGGKNWPAGAYSPLSQTMFFPLQNTCATYEASISSRAERSAYGIRGGGGEIAPGTQNVGTIEAISTVTGRTLWKMEQRAATLSLVTTGGGLVFGGDVAGRFRAYDQKNGNILWEVNLGSQVTGFPVSFAVNGRQYIAVSTGQAVNTGGYLTLTPEIRAGRATNLYVFALPANWQSTRVAPRPAASVSAKAAPASTTAMATPAACRAKDAPAAAANRVAPEGRFSALQSASGKRLYMEQQCVACHGEGMRGTPGAPALANAEFRDAWKGHSLKALLDCTRSTMPPGRLGTLTDAQYLDLIAAMLEANGFKPGSGTALPGDADALSRIVME